MEEKFDDDNPPIDIPPEQEDDINNDWALTEEEEQEQIAAFNAAKSSEWAWSPQPISRSRFLWACLY